ncbi:MAG TPA: helix-turn-helix transcriptional regulator [Phnomibacter sp.]|nr:helix-turn-helix transcriptional regulator [Phnomibacter sp.]
MTHPIQTLASRFGLSQQQLADFLAVHRSMISHIHNGNKAMPSHAYLQLQQLMALDIADSAAACMSSNQSVLILRERFSF